MSAAKANTAPTADSPAKPAKAQKAAKVTAKAPAPRIEHPGLLDVRDLKTYFKLSAGWVRAVDGISFTVAPGQSIGLAGESGCGKTTAATSILKLLPENGKIVAGQILFDGKDLAKRTEYGMGKFRWREIAMIFQGAMNALNPVKEVGDQIAEPIRLHEALSEKAAAARVKELLELVGINPRRSVEYPHQMSGGMRQRAMIAMALACNPKLVIGDEPTTALDVMVQAQILELIERLRRELALSFILISHDLSVMAETCDSGVIMYAGKVVESGSVEQIFNHAAHPYTQRLIKSFPNIAEKREMVSSIPGDPPNLLYPPAGCNFSPRCTERFGPCGELEPVLVETEPGHQVSCHHLGLEAAQAAAAAAESAAKATPVANAAQAGGKAGA